MPTDLVTLFQQTYRELRPRAPMPEFSIRFYPYANINHTIRLRDETLVVRLSDLLRDAPEPVLCGIAHILLAKLYRKPIASTHATRYRRYVSTKSLQQQAHTIRAARGRKPMVSPQGHVHDLEAIFEDLNTRFFHGLMARPRMSWSRDHARRSLGHYDPAHHAIVISKIFDDARVPTLALEYVVYHEMLHLRHPVKLRGSRRCIHGTAFQADENLFPQLAQAKALLKRL